MSSAHQIGLCFAAQEHRSQATLSAGQDARAEVAPMLTSTVQPVHGARLLS